MVYKNRLYGVSDELLGVKINAVPFQVFPGKFPGQFPGGDGYIPVDESGSKSQGTDEGLRGNMLSQLSKIQILVPFA